MKEENKLIAEFMGYTLDDENLESFRIMNNNKIEYILATNMKYHSSWDWLMPVVSKITKMDNYIGLMQRENIMDTIPYGLIDDVYEYVVQFIKYYNHERPI